MSAPSCATCRAFDVDPARLERNLPGLAALSSAHGASRAQDGCCVRHERLVTRVARCGEYAPVMTGQGVF